MRSVSISPVLLVIISFFALVGIGFVTDALFSHRIATEERAGLNAVGAAQRTASAASCVDSDGVNLLVKGSVSSGGRVVNTEQCISHALVREYSCLGDAVVAEDLACPYRTVCADGKCVG